MHRYRLGQIALVTLLTGTLDLIAACTSAFLRRGTPPGAVLKFIASGAFGSEALGGGTGMMLAGVFFHFLIVFCIIAIFFYAYSKMNSLRRSVLLNAVLIAVIAWAVTTLLVIPLSRINIPYPGVEQALISIAILFVCIGLPAALLARKFMK